MTKLLRISMIGTRGVPARYGGFETAVEEIGSRLADRGHVVSVYCRNDGQRITKYRGMELINLPAVRRRAVETLTHSALSVGHAVLPRHRPDVAFVFNAANAPYLAILKAAGISTAVHVDGIEWQRAKWQGIGRRYYMWAEASCARSGLPLIADSQAISTHLQERYGASSIFIPYGAPDLKTFTDRLPELALARGQYHLIVARFEPENHVLELVQSYVASRARWPLIVVGTSPYGHDYGSKILAVAAADPRVVPLGGMFDQELLDQLYGNALTYLHGHSVGGTNPSLLRAMGGGAAVIAYDVVFNREVAGEYGQYFGNSLEATTLIEAAERDPSHWERRGAAGRKSVLARYDWDHVAHAYEQVAVDMAARVRS